MLDPCYASVYFLPTGRVAVLGQTRYRNGTVEERLTVLEEESKKADIEKAIWNELASYQDLIWKEFEPATVQEMRRQHLKMMGLRSEKELRSNSRMIEVTYWAATRVFQATFIAAKVSGLYDGDAVDFDSLSELVAAVLKNLDA